MGADVPAGNFVAENCRQGRRLSFSEVACTTSCGSRAPVHRTVDGLSEVVCTVMASDDPQFLERGLQGMSDKGWERLLQQDEVIAPLTAMATVTHGAADSAGRKAGIVATAGRHPDRPAPKRCRSADGPGPGPLRRRSGRQEPTGACGSRDPGSHPEDLPKEVKAVSRGRAPPNCPQVARAPVKPTPSPSLPACSKPEQHSGPPV